MTMSYFLVLEVPPWLRGSVDLCSLGGTPSPRVWGLEGKAPQESLVSLEPKYEVLHQIVFLPFLRAHFYMRSHETTECGKENPTLRESLNSEL